MDIMRLKPYCMCSCQYPFCLYPTHIGPTLAEILCKPNLILHQQAYPTDASLILTTAPKRIVIAMVLPSSSIWYTMQSLHPNNGPRANIYHGYQRIREVATEWSDSLRLVDCVSSSPPWTILSSKCHSVHACKNGCWRTMMMMMISRLKQLSTIHTLPALASHNIPRTRACDNVDQYLCKLE